MVGKRRNKAPEFCPRHRSPYNKRHKRCLRAHPALPSVPFPANPGIYAGTVDAKGRFWVHRPYEGWKLNADRNKFLLPSRQQNHRWYCFVSSILRGRCSH